MTDNRKGRMTDWLDRRIAAHARSHQVLLADDRADEAAFEKVAENVYGIFRAVLQAAEKSCGGADAAIGLFFLARLERISAEWLASLKQAETHADDRKRHIETIKLDAAQDIRAAFGAIWEEEA